jgi:hypothetical protein
MTVAKCWQKLSTFCRHLCAAYSEVVLSELFNTVVGGKEKGVGLQSSLTLPKMDTIF